MKKGVYICILLLSITSCKGTDGKTLTIATAANMQFAMDELVRTFAEKTDISTHTVVASSGKLTAQIKAGAPYHIFVSADMKYPNTLYKEGFSTKEPQIYAYGTLVLWSTSKTTPELDSLLQPNIAHIAIANPKNAPYGKAAITTLAKLNMLDSLRGKLVYGESIAQTNQFVLSGAAQVGFTAKAVVLSPKMEDQGCYSEIPSHLYNPISQGVIVVKQEHLQTESQLFYEFLFSSEAQSILRKYGYTIPEKSIGL